jgi:hypothetical protein
VGSNIKYRGRICILGWKADYAGMQLETLAPKKSIEERRSNARTPRTAVGRLFSPTSSDSGERIEISTIDFSRHGVAFLSRRAIPVRAFYIIEIEEGAEKITREIKTMRCKKLADDSYVIGARFH